MAKEVNIYNISVNKNSVKIGYYLPNPSAYIPDIYDGGWWPRVIISYGFKSLPYESWTHINITEGYKWPGNNSYTLTSVPSGEYGIQLEAEIAGEGTTVEAVIVVTDEFTVSNAKKPNAILKVGNADGKSWTNFTDCLVAPNYKVNNIGVSEEWEDANWVKHYVTPRKRIQGTFELLFTDKAKYYLFLDLLKKNESYEEEIKIGGGRTVKRKRGPGIVKLKLQVNNELDDFSAENYADRQPMIYSGLFNIRWEPTWFVPFIGVKEYDAIEVEIEEE